MLILIKKFKLLCCQDHLSFGILKNCDKVGSLKKTHDYANDNFAQMSWKCAFREGSCSQSCAEVLSS